MSGYTYLASPYTHSDPEVRIARYAAVVKHAGKLMMAGEVVFCPVAHCHPIELAMSEPQNAQFWSRQDIPLLAGASKLKVLMLPGWSESGGVREEIEYAGKHGIPIEYEEDE